MQERTDEDIKASNDGILKTVNEMWDRVPSNTDNAVWLSRDQVNELPKRANAVILNKN